MKTNKLMCVISSLSILLVCLSFFSCKKDDKKVDPPKVDVILALSGKVTAVSGDVVAGAAVKVSGAKEYSATTDSKGEYKIDPMVAGDYTVVVTMSDKIDVGGKIVLPDDGKSHLEVFNAVMTARQKPVNVTPVAEHTITAEAEVPQEYKEVAPVVNVVIPAGAVKAETQVTITPMFTKGEANSTAEEAKNASVLTIKCEPSGLVFDKPVAVELENNMQGAVFTNVELQYLDKGAWVSQAQAVTVNEKGNYTTQISHFSSYRIVAVLNVTSSDKGTQNVALEPDGGVFDNLNGNKEMVADKLSYSYKFGAETVTDIPAALAALGITDAATIASVKLAVHNTVSTIPATYNVNVKLPVGTKVVYKAVQDVVTNNKSLNIDVYSDNGVKTGTKVLKIVEKIYSAPVFSFASTVVDDHKGGGK